MIELKNGVFGLHGEGFSCLLRINKYGLLELLHFGEALSTGMAKPSFADRASAGVRRCSWMKTIPKAAQTQCLWHGAAPEEAIIGKVRWNSAEFPPISGARTAKS